jgi:HD-GYP domain-containing protein (c-di-GMP phosphodiesterase class II)
MAVQTQLMGLALTQLRIDTALPWNLYDEAGHLLLTRGFVLVRNAQVDSLIERGVFVREEDFKLNNYPDVVRSTPPPAEEEVDPFRVREQMAGKLALLLRDAAQDPSLIPDFAAKIGEVARVVHKLCDLHLDATLAAIFLTDHSKYPILHSIDTAVLVDLLARKMTWSDAQRRTAVCAALSMNIAMIDAQTILALQRLPLSAVQKEAIAMHPARGADMLRAAGVSDELWLRIVADHHEVPDGTGYPAGKRTLDEETLLVRTMDIYAALVTPRHTRAASDSAMAARSLFVQENKYANTLVGLLIKEIGLHPPGSYVKLKNGDVAVVYKRASATTPPMVHSFINGKGLPMLEPMWRDATRPEFAIASAVPRDQVTTKVDLIKIWSARSRA